MIRVGDEAFNKLLKGQYAYFVGMRYAVPFSEITTKDYIDCEQDIKVLLQSDKTYWDVLEGDLRAYVDEEYTDRANSIAPFVRENKYTTGPEITLDDLRKFRSWLATELLTFTGMHTDKFVKVLQYYKNGMYDDTVQVLSDIAGSQQLTDLANLGTQTSGCGCGCSGPVGRPGLPGVHTQNRYTIDMSFGICDVLGTYRKYIYDQMVEQFGNLEYWNDMPTGFLAEFKTYIDGILGSNLPLRATRYKNLANFDDCACLRSTSELANRPILEDLSRALQYILDEDITGHRAQISDAFTKWATVLYESMQWTTT